VMAALGIAAGAKGVNRQGAHLRRKLDDAHVSRAGNAVEVFLSRRWTCIKRKHGAVAAADSRNWKTRTRIIKLIAFTFIRALEPVEVTPRNAPRAKVLFKSVKSFVECGQPIFGWCSTLVNR